MVQNRKKRRMEELNRGQKNVPPCGPCRSLHGVQYQGRQLPLDCQNRVSVADDFREALANPCRVRQKGVAQMNAAVAIEYGTLLSETKPEVIQDENQNRYYIAELEKLTSLENVTPAQEKLIHLLTVLIEDFEEKQYPLPDAGPLDIIRHVMEVHRLRQKDLVDVFGTESIVSDVLNGKRELTKEHIRRLSDRFGVSPAVFF